MRVDLGQHLGLPIKELARYAEMLIKIADQNVLLLG